jgi:hypothetical protein
MSRSRRVPVITRYRPKRDLSGGAVVRYCFRTAWPVQSDRYRDSGAKGDFMAKRTTHRSSKGTKLYAVRDKSGKFKDIQTYKRAHSADIKRKSKKEK